VKPINKGEWLKQIEKERRKEKKERRKEKKEKKKEKKERRKDKKERRKEKKKNGHSLSPSTPHSKQTKCNHPSQPLSCSIELRLKFDPSASL
jgi:hypothetical protein